MSSHTHDVYASYSRYVTANNVVVRKKASNKGKIVGSYKKAAKVRCYKKKRSYTKIKYGRYYRYIATRYLSKKKPVVGSGTVLDGTTARLAIMNGAQFIIAPCYDEDVQEMCNLYQIPYAPGCTSYTEMLTALKAGASFIKAFPISNYYGPDLAKVIKVPCPQVPIMASGGANFDNLATWFKNGVDCVGLGGLLTK